MDKLTFLAVNINKLSGCFDDALLSICDQLSFENPEEYINSGNSFNGLWNNFCECGVGSCNTNFDIEINTNNPFQNEYQTVGNIYTKGNVNINTGQSVTYISTITTLNEGFEAKTGCELFIDPNKCQ